MKLKEIGLKKLGCQANGGACAGRAPLDPPMMCEGVCVGKSQLCPPDIFK